MSYYKFGVGLSNVGSYQVAGSPWMTGSVNLNNGVEDKIEFPKITKSITVTSVSSSDGTGVDVHFNSLTDGRVSGGTHFKRLVGGETFTFNVKCKEIYISNPASGTQPLEYRVVAELTNIPTERMFVLTGSGLTD
jgi:hypothetical protein